MYQESTEEYLLCYNNKLVRSINNTEGFLNFLGEIVNNLKFEYYQNILIHTEFSSDFLTQSENYNLMETILYYYIEPAINNIDDVMKVSFLNMLKKKKKKQQLFLLFL